MNAGGPRDKSPKNNQTVMKKKMITTTFRCNLRNKTHVADDDQSSLNPAPREKS
jgi:hypothetical protein